MADPNKGDPAPQQHPPTHGPRNLHAPWRLSYMDLLSSSKPDTDQAAPDYPDATCFLRDYWLHPADDQQNHVIVRTGTEETQRGGLILLNKYPYANGHLLVALGEGHQRLLDYNPVQRAELWSMVELATDICERALNPQGINIGVNQGMAAGAGIPHHLHVHVVPRWEGDVNFMSVVGNIRVIPSALEEMARRYRDVWAQIADHG